MEGAQAAVDRRGHVVLGVTGSVAAFKAADIAARLRRAGARVTPVLTAAACRFITPLTLSALAGEAALTDLWQQGERPLHLDLARADLLLIAPATADFLARAALGRADDLLAATLLSRGIGRPTLFAPAMESELWAHPLTRAHMAALEALGHARIGPVDGPLGSGASGMGRMADVEAIVEAALARLGPRDLVGLRLVVTAGPTQEPIDAVRYVGNRSSGRMGYAVAGRALARGASVVLVSGPVALVAPDGVDLRRVATAAEMAAAVALAVADADAVVAAAAVADYRPAEARSDKMRRTSERMRVDLVRNPDVLGGAVAAPGRDHRVMVGFAAEVGDAAASALDKCRRKGLDLCVGNDIADPETTFGSDRNRLVLASPDGTIERLDLLSKAAAADRLLDRVAVLWQARRGGATGSA